MTSLGVSDSVTDGGLEEGGEGEATRVRSLSWDWGSGGWVLRESLGGLQEGVGSSRRREMEP